MRLKKVPYASDLIKEHEEIVIPNPKEYKGNWNKLFSNDNPIHIEIGMGKGKFIYELATNNPDLNFIGIEKFDSVIVRALEKQLEEKLDNLLLIRMDASILTECFNIGEIKRIYLNFSDPWPKERHAKRRLTNKRFLERYQQVLEKDGEIHFKTDNLVLFEYSLESITEYGMTIVEKYYDLHNENIENYMTEFEQKYSEKGNKICKLITKFGDNKNG